MTATFELSNPRMNISESPHPPPERLMCTPGVVLRISMNSLFPRRSSIWLANMLLAVTGVSPGTASWEIAMTSSSFIACGARVMTPTLCLPATSTVFVSYPMYEMRSWFTPFASFSVNLPSMSVVQPNLVLSPITVTPTKGNIDSASTIVPTRFFCWANRPMQMLIKNRNNVCLFIYVFVFIPI